MTFTIEQFRKYLLKSDSLGDALYFLSEKAVLEANEIEEIGEDMEEDPDDYPEGYIANL